MATRAFQVPETVPIWIEVKNTSGDLTDPESASIVIYDPDGSIVMDGESESRAMAGSGTTGYMVYYFESTGITDFGWYRVIATILDGTGETERTTVENGGFTLA